MLQKIFKGLAIFIGVVILALLILPFAFKGKITKITKNQINNQVNAVVDFKDISISFFRSFPDVSVDVQQLSVINKAPFQGDTLAAVGHTYVDVSLSSLLGNQPKINHIKIADVLIHVKVNKDSIANYDIALPTEIEETNEEKSSAITLAIQEYSLENVNLFYVDEVSNRNAQVKNFNHSGSGDLSKNVLELDTHTDADAITFTMDNIAYLKEVQLKYDAKVGVDYAKDLKLTFKENVAYVNDFQLAFDGFFEMLETSYNMDFEISSKESSFKSLLSLIPNAYTQDFPNVTTTGNLEMQGKVKGTYSENTIPTMDMVVKTDDASVKYPDLPNTIEHINIHTQITNTTGLMDDLVVEVRNFGFQIAQDVFAASATISKPISNLTVASKIKGKVNLASVKNAYPVPPLDFDLKGIVAANIEANFTMDALEKEQYNKIDSKGVVTLTNVAVGSDYTLHPLLVKKAKMLFSLNHVDLKEASLQSGKSDIQLNGGLDNVYGYVFSDGILKGKLNATSSNFYVSDFYEGDTTTVNTTDSLTTEQFKIPANIVFVGNVKAKKVVYDNMELTNFTGKTKVAQQKITFSNAKANVFKGTALIEGFVDTKPNPTVYDFNMKLQQVDIAAAFTTMEMLQKIAPIIGAFNGRFDTDLDINGALGNDFMPVMSQLTGQAFANLQVDKIDASKNKFLSLAENKMSFLDFDKTDLNDLKTKVTFKDSKVNVAPFTLKYKDIPVTIQGNHSFDNQMDYNLKLDLPVKYLGTQASSLVSKLSSSEQENVKVPLEVKVGGTVTNPTVFPGMKSAVSELTQKVISGQKEKAKAIAKNKIKEVLSSNTKQKKDSTYTPQDKVKEAGKKILQGLFGK